MTERKRAAPRPHTAEAEPARHELVGDHPRGRWRELWRRKFAFRLGRVGVEMLGGGFYEPCYWRNYLHRHSFYEICYAYRGQGVFRMEGAELPVAEGDIFVAKPGEVHEIISARRNAMGIYFWSFALNFPSRETERGHRPTEAEAATTALLERFAASRVWVSRRTESLPATLELLTAETIRGEAGLPEAVSGLLGKLILDTARSVTDAQPAPAGEAPARTPAEAQVRQALRFLRDNYARPITSVDVAAQLHLSRRQLSRLFRSCRGQTVQECLVEIRLETARRLLLDPAQSIKQVALACGYADYRHFLTLFRQHVGATPAAFRRGRGTVSLVKPKKK